MLFLDSGPKTYKNLNECKEVQENLADYFTKYHYIKHHKMVRPIYLQAYKMPGTVLLVLLNPELQGCVDPVDSNMEQLRNTFLIIQIAWLRVASTRTKYRRTIEIRKG